MDQFWGKRKIIMTSFKTSNRAKLLPLITLIKIGQEFCSLPLSLKVMLKIKNLIMSSKKKSAFVLSTLDISPVILKRAGTLLNALRSYGNASLVMWQ